MSDETAAILRDFLRTEFQGVHAELQLIRGAQQQDGLKLAAIDERCATRRQHCSAEFTKLGSRTEKAEDTGVHNLVELQKRAASASTLKAVVKYVIVALTAAGIVVGIWASVSNSKATTNHRAPAAVVDARR